MPISPHLKIGTCSWKYDSWKGIVYSENVGNDYLREYAQQYDTVEIDQWFWSLFPSSPVALPKDDVVKEYTAAVPDNFRFAIKIPNSITLTHYYHVFLQGYYMPHIFPLYNSYKKYINDVSVIRLHGPNRSGIEKKTQGDWSQIVEPKDDELSQLVKMIVDLWGDKVDVHVYLNNHYEGSAPKSISRILDRL